MACVSGGDVWRRPLHGVLFGPLLGLLDVLGVVAFEDAGDFRDERVVWVGVAQERADGQQDLADGQCRRPLRSQYVQADRSVRIDVGVIDLCSEANLWRFKRVISWEVNCQKENSSLKWRVIRSHNGCLPVKKVVSNRSSTAL